jgi:ABC-type transport system involved in multi-copper enzyme maturation permease subunit
MIWLTWRQFRTQAITAVAALAAFAILLALTASHMSSLYDASGLTSCHGHGCAGPANTFLVRLSSGQGFRLLPAGSNLYVIVYFLAVLAILVAPAIVGIFWGAPLIARELETGTCRLAWNQSITRTRWLAVKLTLIGLTAMVIAEAFSLLQAWWAAPIGRAVALGGHVSIFTEGRFGPFVFPTHGITPLGYAAFAFALGVTAGLLIRRSIPAMAVTLAIFAAFQIVTPLWIRPHLLPASQRTTTIEAAQASVISIATIGPAHASVSLPTRSTMALMATAVPGQPGAWIISSGSVNAAGHPDSTVPAACRPARPSGSVRPGSPALNNCLASHGIRVTESYQPASHFWPLQGAETAFFLVLALALAGFCFWQLDRRRT